MTQFFPPKHTHPRSRRRASSAATHDERCETEWVGEEVRGVGWNAGVDRTTTPAALLPPPHWRFARHQRVSTAHTRTHRTGVATAERRAVAIGERKWKEREEGGPTKRKQQRRVCSSYCFSFHTPKNPPCPRVCAPPNPSWPRWGPHSPFLPWSCTHRWDGQSGAVARFYQAHQK